MCRSIWVASCAVLKKGRACATSAGAYLVMQQLPGGQTCSQEGTPAVAFSLSKGEDQGGPVPWLLAAPETASQAPSQQTLLHWSSRTMWVPLGNTCAAIMCQQGSVIHILRSQLSPTPPMRAHFSQHLKLSHSHYACPFNSP